MSVFRLLISLPVVIQLSFETILDMPLWENMVARPCDYIQLGLMRL